ncbi:hypothetical protein [Streptomyces sp. RK62]|uniref:hypothetical protein n=1 Tax=Streptomyces sp. RK62 TaxID=2824893 RepID=UPI001B35B2F1|nr:hypothetical protein [Streptomyces sp. RK62]MBQ0997454.1 hypothetical protein [Streptomyces sp. RK62]
MTDTSSAESEDSQPEEPENHTEGTPSGTPAPQGESFRWAPGVDPVDVTDLMGARETVRRASEQITGQLTSLNSFKNRLDELFVGLAKARVPLSIPAVDPALLKHVRDVARIKIDVPTLDPGLLKQMQDIARIKVDVPVWHASLAKQMQEAARVKVQVPDFDFGVDLGRILADNRSRWLEAMRGFAEAIKRVIPENLRDLSTDDLQKVFQVNDEDGTSLAWAPRSAIVAELLQAEEVEARSAVFVENAAAIADDIDVSLATVTVADHGDLRSMLLEATAAIRHGLYGPAQAAAAAVDVVVNVHMMRYLECSGRESRNQTRSHFHPIKLDEWEDATLPDVELVLVGAGIATIFERWGDGYGSTSFNRNGTAHAAGGHAYSPAHAIRAALIAHAALRWIDEAIVHEQPLDDAA